MEIRALSKAKIKLTPSQERKRAAVESLQKYMAAYDKEYGYLDYSDTTFIDDMLYGIGRALDKKYEFANGFDTFKGVLREHLKARPEGERSKEHEERAAALFLAYVCYNYPSRTIIHDPAWHAPKLFRAALRALKDGELPPPMNSRPEKP